ncbi:hypothetical protein [Pleomorphomonas koreensis]|uniref:hypothetical protein n=1 Tax=Pleomorphomonas koreensis TaxID=257440 RepID=UPI000425AF75|nr:hypothetical protein [Pleomorphomonas koreensis]
MVAAFVLLLAGTVDWAAGAVETTSRQVVAFPISVAARTAGGLLSFKSRLSEERFRLFMAAMRNKMSDSPCSRLT